MVSLHYASDFSNFIIVSYYSEIKEEEISVNESPELFSAPESVFPTEDELTKGKNVIFYDYTGNVFLNDNLKWFKIFELSHLGDLAINSLKWFQSIELENMLISILLKPSKNMQSEVSIF